MPLSRTLSPPGRGRAGLPVVLCECEVLRRRVVLQPRGAPTGHDLCRRHQALLGLRGDPMTTTTRSAHRRTVVAAAILLGLVAGACSDEDESSSTFAEAACPTPNVPGIPSLDFPPAARCGYLTVPEDRSKPGGRTIRIFVLRLPATSPNPKPDPIVVLSGGPGGGGSIQFGQFLGSPLNVERDIILFDQRGSLQSSRLGCAEYDEALNSAISIPFTSDEQTAKQVAAVTACRDAATAAGIDRASYDTAENA